MMSETTGFNDPNTNPAEAGLRSSRGIRWLLLAGALVSGVSVYRLVQSQWASMPVPLQFLILVAGALAVFALGTVTRRRLHLPYAGSALLFLFTGLIPVLAWGAAALDLLSTPSGWIAFGVGGAALLGAAGRVLRSELGYRGVLYPAVLGAFVAAQPVLPWIARRLDAPDAVYVAAALALGVLLHVGSRHVNRFFFHRDRRDGVDRPVHLVPFLLLGALYAGALTLLDLDSAFLALPLAVVGVVLAGTAEEYLAALSRVLGTAPVRWPGRSLALAALGFSLLTAAVPLSFFDSSRRCLALVTLLAAVFLLRWAVRYGSAGAHAAGLAAALCAWWTAKALFPSLAARLAEVLANLTGLSPEGAALPGLYLLCFLVLLLAGSLVLRRIGSPEHLLRVQAGAAVLVIPAATGLGLLAALFEPGGVVLLLVLALAVATALMTRRPEAAVVVPMPLAALAAWSEMPPAGLALLTQALFVLSWLAARRDGPVHRLGARRAAFLHACLGMVWLVRAVATSEMTVEPLILLLAGAALAVEGYAARRRHFVTAGLALLAAYLPVQIAAGGWIEPASTAFLVAIALAAPVLAACVLAVRRFRGRLEAEAWDDLAVRPVADLVRVWGALAVVSCLILAGWAAAVLAFVLVAVVFLARVELAGRSLKAAIPLRPLLLLLIQLAVVALGAGTLLGESILSHDLAILPVAAVLVLGWRVLVEVLRRRAPLEPWVALPEGVLLLGYGAAFLERPDLTFAGHVTMVAAAAAWAAVSFETGRRGKRTVDAWALQLWIGAAVLHVFTAGWLRMTGGLAPYVLLAAGAGLYALSAWWKRTGLGAPFSGPCRITGLALPAAAGLLALARSWMVPGGSVWLPVLAAFLASLFFLVVAMRDARRVYPALASALLLGGALLTAVSRADLGLGLSFLAPGLSLLALAWMLRDELGPAWSRHVAAAGASCIYATPVVALSSSVSWSWLAALGVLAVAFGAASFQIRSRSLLTVSTAALLTDLGFFVFRIGTTAPTLLWILGAGFGLALMAAAAWLEYQREGVLQQVRVFGRELRAWS